MQWILKFMWIPGFYKNGINWDNNKWIRWFPKLLGFTVLCWHYVTYPLLTLIWLYRPLRINYYVFSSLSMKLVFRLFHWVCHLLYALFSYACVWDTLSLIQHKIQSKEYCYLPRLSYQILAIPYFHSEETVETLFCVQYRNNLHFVSFSGFDKAKQEKIVDVSNHSL